MGEDRHYIAVVAKSRRGKRVFVEEYYPGQRADIAWSLMRDFVENRAYNTDLIGVTLLLERSYRLEATVENCNIWALKQTAGRWAGKQVYALGDNMYDVIFSETGAVEVITIDITPLVELAVMELATCEYYRLKLRDNQCIYCRIEGNDDPLINNLRDLATETIFAVMLRVGSHSYWRTPTLFTSFRRLCETYGVYCFSNVNEQWRFDYLTGIYRTTRYKDEYGELDDSVAPLLSLF